MNIAIINVTRGTDCNGNLKMEISFDFHQQTGASRQTHHHGTDLIKVVP